MVRAAMVVHTRPGPYSSTPVDLTGFDTFDNADGMTLAVDGVTELIFRNPDSGSHTFTVHSAPDPLGRGGSTGSGNITTHAVAAGAVALIGELAIDAWRSGGGSLCNIDASYALQYLAIRRAPGT